MQYVTWGIVCPQRTQHASGNADLVSKSRHQADPVSEALRIVHSEQLAALGAHSGLVVQSFPGSGSTAFRASPTRPYSHQPSLVPVLSDAAGSVVDG